MLKTICLIITLVFANLAQADWPRRTPAQAGFEPRTFNSFVRKASAQHLTFKTDSLLVIKDGHLVFEGYYNNYHQDQRHALFSLGKTMINALYGIMEHQGLVHRDDLLSQYYPTGHSSVTLRHLLNMSSGIDWIEEDSKDLLASDPWFAFYSRESYRDMPAWVDARGQAHSANTKFNYSSGDSGLLVAAMRGAVAESDYANFAWKNLFRPLGMNTVAIEKDGSGFQALHGSGFASTRDIARLGLLYLSHGVVEGRQLWPADWVNFTATRAPAQSTPADPNDRNLQNNQAYGAQIWLNIKRAGDKARPYPELPSNALLGLGSRGQILMILPTEKLIMVRTATDSELSVTNRKDYRHGIFKALYYSLKRGGS